MSVRIDNEKEFISLFNSISRGTRRIQVFTDFISCSVIAIQNGLQFCCKHTRFSSTHFLRFPVLRPSAGTPPVSGYSGIHEAARCCIPSASDL